MALQTGNGLSDFLFASQISDAPAGHGVSLAVAVNRDSQSLCLFIGSRERKMLSSIVKKLFVNFISHDQKLMFFDKRAQSPQFVLGVKSAGRIGRRIENQKLALRR